MHVKWFDMQTEIHQLYRVARLGFPTGTPVAVLHIGEQETVIATGAGSEPESMLKLAIGSHRTAAEFFLHMPPSPGEIENAIMQVEDEITRAREMIAGYSTLVTSDASIREILHIASGHTGSAMQLTIDAVEQVFSLLASHSLGRPASISGISANPAFAATLLILREFMHHLRFLAIHVTA
jgi:exopolyphosphatase/pppGpp-phosphohydrolase